MDFCRNGGPDGGTTYTAPWHPCKVGRTRRCAWHAATQNMESTPLAAGRHRNGFWFVYLLVSLSSTHRRATQVLICIVLKYHMQQWGGAHATAVQCAQYAYFSCKPPSSSSTFSHGVYFPSSRSLTLLSSSGCPRSRARIGRPQHYIF